MDPSSTSKISANASITRESSGVEDEETDISTLPQEQSWQDSLNFCKYQGFWVYSFSLKGVLLFQKNFIPQPNDVILCTPPKSGTTWLKALAFAISTRTKFPDFTMLTQNMPHDVVPFQELAYLLGQNRDIQNPLISTHVSFTSLPKSILNSSTTKIIYLCRNPKDVLVSMWLFLMSNNKRSDDDVKIVPFKEAYEKFCTGVSVYGPYWDHVLGYWKASLEFPDRVLFLKYEDMKNDTRGLYVKKMADFMGCPFSADEKEQGIAEKVVKLCSFENLSNLDVNKNKNTSSKLCFKVENNSFFRKGKIGDWKNYLTDEMAERIDQITHQKFSSCEY